MTTLHSIYDIWIRRFKYGDNALMSLMNNRGYAQNRNILLACERINRDEELPNASYETDVALDLIQQIESWQAKLGMFSVTVHGTLADQLDQPMQNLIERSLNRLSSVGNLSNYRIPNTLGIEYWEIGFGADYEGKENGAYILSETIGFQDFMLLDESEKYHLKNNPTGTLYVKAFADLYQKDYDLYVKTLTHFGKADELDTTDEYMSMILTRGSFDPLVADGAWKKIRDVIQDALIIPPLMETITGKDFNMGFALTSGERMDSGITAGVGITMAYKINKWYGNIWDDVVAAKAPVERTSDANIGT